MRASHMGVESLRMWKKIFIHKREEYINLYKSESMVVSLASSNSSAEWAFNLPSLMPFSDRCLFMNHDTLQALMSINIIEKLWTPKEREREELIDYAVQTFISKRRTKKTVKPPAKPPRIEPDVIIKSSSDSSNSNIGSSFADTENDSETNRVNDVETD